MPKHTLAKSPIHRRAHTPIHTHTHTYGQLRLSLLVQLEPGTFLL
uniref:Uncharacterized protein n=1 Tax=Anguilla anguilla TaxID=7936 RepID=A0A0E9SNN5_ANGAN